MTRLEKLEWLGLVALALCLWLVAPMVPLGGGYPLAPPWIRAGMACTVLLVGGLLLWRRHRRPSAGAAQQAGAIVQPPEDVQRLALSEAVEWSRLRGTRKGALGERAYALPWVLLAGAAGSGRSALVRAAGFEPAPEMRAAGDTTWWLTEEAVLIEPPGDWFHAGASPDPATRLAEALSTERPRRPLDAVALAIPVEALLADPRGAATGPRARLQQLMRALGAVPPLQIAITRCDRVPGFTAAMGRFDAGGLALGAQGKPHQDVEAGLRAPLEALMAAGAQRLPYDLAQERDLTRRAEMLAWQAQSEQLTAAALTFVQELLRAGAGDLRLDLRGLHFTAAGGDARGAADAWASAFAEHFALDRPATPPAITTGTDLQPSFVGGWLRGVVLASAATGGVSRVAERRTAIRHLTGYAACLGVFAVLATVWTLAFGAHRAQLSRFEERLGALAGQERALDAATNPGLDEVLALLRTARSLATMDETVLAGSGHWLGLALPRPALALDAGARAYDRLLLGHLLPLLRARMAAQMPGMSDLAALRGLLRLYLASGSADHYDAAAFRNWANAALQSALVQDPAAQAVALRHVTRLAALLPAPGGLNPAVIAEARNRLRQRPEAQIVYAELRRQAEAVAIAPPLNIVGSLGAAGSQLLMLRHQAGLQVVVPGFYTRAGFFGVFLPRLPLLLQGNADDAFVLGTDLDDAGRDALMRAVTELYTAEYVRHWRGVVEQTALRALPDLPSVMAGLQALSGSDSPLVALVELVRDNTDLQPLGEASALLNRAAGALGGVAGTAAAAATAGGAAIAVPANWPGTAIRTPFVPIIALAGQPGSQAVAARLQGVLSGSLGLVSGIASAPSPAAAAHLAAAAAIGGQGSDPISALRTQAATLPRPLDGIFRDLHGQIWNVLIRLAMERIGTAWTTEVAPACLQGIARRYPLAGADATPDRDILPRDFAAFFGPNGTMDRWVTTNLQPFTQASTDGTLVPVSRNGLRLPIPAEAMAQVNRARQFRELFFDASGALAVRLAVTPMFLDPRALSATLQADAMRQVYRHEPPRAVEFRWPGADEGGNASLALALVEGGPPREIQAAGPWALFRLFDQAQRSQGRDRMTVDFIFGDVRVSYAMRGNSASNPFGNRDWREFRCLARL